ncbi:EamA family transporter [Colwellia sp. MSW7]|uniref:EamA family transporter n=1 Tax=Colwellia maritima TaxID=2912588 RepID=A0ABS9X389_9GAMM|nr:EamA family transporter [Colwellia maritima]MCI2283946.1 EamA family transporter [Colwellia maritima]
MANKIDISKGIIAIVIASFLWGTTGTAASYAHQVSALGIGAFSTGIGGILLFVAARKKIQIDLSCLFSRPMVILFGSACVAIYPLAFYSAMRFSGVAIGTVVSIASAPFFAVLLERLISKKSVSIKWVVSFIIGVLGIVLLVMGRSHENSTLANAMLQNIGVMLGLLAGLAYAGYSWAAKHLIEKGVHSQSAVAVQFGIASCCLIPSLWFTGDNILATVTNASVVVYMAIAPMFLGYLLFGFGLKVIDASRATLITLIEPLVATLLAIFIVGESFKMIGRVGMGLVTLCLLLQTLPFTFNTQKKASVSTPLIQ